MFLLKCHEDIFLIILLFICIDLFYELFYHFLFFLKKEKKVFNINYIYILLKKFEKKISGKQNWTLAAKIKASNINYCTKLDYGNYEKFLI